MKKILPLPVLIYFIGYLTVSCREKPVSFWQPVKGQLLTQWAFQVSPQTVWPEYPRPQMVRDKWINLNGLWEYSISGNDTVPKEFTGQILVPFPIESALSGVARTVGKEKTLWYKRKIIIPGEWENKIILLHFEAVDWETNVWLDEKIVGRHKGGFDPFSFDITEFVISGKSHELIVSVWDPTDEGFQPRGKQVNDPGGIFYTSCTGIWQSVWLEPVPNSFIEKFTILTDIDTGKVYLTTKINHPEPVNFIEIEISQNEKTIANKQFDLNQIIVLDIPNPIMWTPENPFLYDLKVKLVSDKKITDEIKSYLGMRKITVQKDEMGFNRLAINNEILFLSGTLDQGYWPDGIYTPPNEEAMRYDIEMTKIMGFNMLRKHVKVENRRFYYLCDKMGVIVWQDMPSAKGYVPIGGEDLNPSEEHKKQFEIELKKMIETHQNHPSIVMWIPFNEGWGQYDTKRITEVIYSLDPTRLVNNASGWEDHGAGNVMDIHHYPEPKCPEQEQYRASVLGEFGGLGFFIENHTWKTENWGYEKMHSMDDLLIKFEDFYRVIDKMAKINGLSASVYTQITDVETETNGLITYDRHLVKMGAENVYNAQNGIIPPRLISPFKEFIDTIEINLVAPDTLSNIYYSIDGTEPGKYSEKFIKPVLIKKSITLKALCIWPDGSKSRVITYDLVKKRPQKAIQAVVKQGLKVSLFEGKWDILPDFRHLLPIKIGLTSKIDIDFSEKKELFGLDFEGYLDVPETGSYILYLVSDDGGRLYLDGNSLIDYDGIHGAGEQKKSVVLEKGLHPFRLIYFQRYGGSDLKVLWQSPGMAKSQIAENFWKH